MRKLTLVLLFVGVIAVGAFAQTSATLNLSGTVGDIIQLDLTPEPVASNLVLSVDQLTPLQVATVTETSNVPYNVNVTTAGGAFQFTNGTDTLAYTLYYNGSAVGSSGAIVSTGSSANSLDRPVSITYNGADPSLSTGAYSDTVTFTISAQ